MTTFSDIFKKSFLEEAGNLTMESFLMSMLAAFLCSMIVYAVYRGFYKGVIYMILLVWNIFGLFLNIYAAYEYGNSIQYRISLFLFPLGWIALAYYVWLKLHETTNL